MLTATIPLVNLLSCPLWGWLADSRQQHKRVPALSILSAGMLGALLAIPCSFYWLWVTLVPLELFLSPLVPIMDSSVLQSLGKQRERYGRIRLWGAGGWGVCASLASRLAEQMGLQGLIVLFGIRMGVNTLLATRLTVSPTLVRPAGLEALSRFWADPPRRAFLFTAFSGGVILSVISNFLFLFLQDLWTSQTLLGFSLTVATISQVSVLYISSALLKRWHPQQLLMVGLLLFSLRCLLYFFMTKPWIVMPIQLMHGISNALMWVTGASYAGMMAPPGLNATAQRMFSSAIMGVGMGVGSLVGVFFLEQVGAVWDWLVP